MPIEVLRTFLAQGRRRAADGRGREKYAAALLEIEATYHGVDAALLTAIWRHRHNISAYDALAQAYDLPLVTFDQRLAKAASSLDITIVVPA